MITETRGLGSVWDRWLEQSAFILSLFVFRFSDGSFVVLVEFGLDLFPVNGLPDLRFWMFGLIFLTRHPGLGEDWLLFTAHLLRHGLLMLGLTHFAFTWFFRQEIVPLLLQSHEICTIVRSLAHSRPRIWLGISKNLLLLQIQRRLVVERVRDPRGDFSILVFAAIQLISFTLVERHVLFVSVVMLEIVELLMLTFGQARVDLAMKLQLGLQVLVGIFFLKSLASGIVPGWSIIVSLFFGIEGSRKHIGFRPLVLALKRVITNGFIHCLALHLMVGRRHCVMRPTAYLGVGRIIRPARELRANIRVAPLTILKPCRSFGVEFLQIWCLRLRVISLVHHQSFYYNI